MCAHVCMCFIERERGRGESGFLRAAGVCFRRVTVWKRAGFTVTRVQHRESGVTNLVSSYWPQ